MNLRIRTLRFALVFASLLVPVFVHAQTPGDFARPDLPGRHTITGILFTAERSPAGRGVQIRVSSGANDVSVWTDQDGKFTLNRVMNGTYSITVEAGEEYEPITNRLEVALPANAQPTTFFINLQLRYRPNMTPKPQVVDARLAGVPAKALENYGKAKSAIGRAETKAAVDALVLAVAEYPSFTAAHTELGIQYQKLGQLEKAEEHLRTALTLKPNTYETMANLGIVLSRRAKHEEAETVLLEVLAIRNDSPITYFYLGRSLLAQEKLASAETSLKNALKMGGSEMVEVHRSLANLYLKRGEDARAVAELEAYLAEKSGMPDEAKLRETIQQIKNLRQKDPDQ